MARRLPAGFKRHPITIWSHVAETSLDSYGQISASTTAYTTKTVRASIKPISGHGVDATNQQYSRATYELIVDYSSTLASTGAVRRKIVWGTRTLNIMSISNVDADNVEMRMICEELVE